MAAQSLAGWRQRVVDNAAYDLDVMVLDAVGVLDAYGIEAAHWVGFSMGGMIAQLAAATQPARVRSLTSLMSGTNCGDLPAASWSLMARLMLRPSRRAGHAARVRDLVRKMAALQGGTYKTPKPVLRRLAQDLIARGGNPDAGAHHYAAILATGGFRRRLAKVVAPTLIVHGTDDKLIHPDAGRRSAEAIEGARFRLVEGMGHELSVALLPRLSRWIVDHIQAAQARPRPIRLPQTQVGEPVHDVVIVGAGFSGIGLGIQLQRAGIDNFLLLEKAGEVGGTWRDNTYPGCACDVQSHLYSFSFQPKADWSRKFASWDEIGQYLRDCVDTYCLKRHLQLGTALVGARYDERACLWHLTLQTRTGQRETTTRALTFAVGPLSQPRYPAIDGLDRFEGPAFHSARWDHTLDLAGKRVAVIGTGASAIQFIPQVAKSAGDVTVFQRTPAWILPKSDRTFTAAEKALFRHADWVRRGYRAGIYWLKEWGLRAFLNQDSRLRGWLRQRCLDHLHAEIADPGLRAKLTPTYEVGCKRILQSDDFYQALVKPHVHLVTDAITHVDANRVHTAAGSYAADVIIYGTGFVVDRPTAAVDVVGVGGQHLAAQWRADGFESYLGTTVTNFPNLFIMAGPNTGIGHTSLLVMIEAQASYIAQAVAHLRHGTARSLDVRTTCSGTSMTR